MQYKQKSKIKSIIKQIRSVREFAFSAFVGILIWIFVGSCKARQVTCEALNSLTQTSFLSIHSSDSLQALNQLNKTLQADSNCTKALLMKADLLFGNDVLDSSLALYNRVIGLDTSLVYPIYRSGFIEELQENYTNAIQYYSVALQKKITGPYVADYQFKPELDGTLAVDYDVSSEFITFRLSICHYYLSDYRRAMEGFTYCVDNSIMLSESLLYRGSIFLMQDNLDSACQDFNRSLRYGNLQAGEYIKDHCLDHQK